MGVIKSVGHSEFSKREEVLGLVQILHLYFCGTCIFREFMNNELPEPNHEVPEQSLDLRFARRPHLRRRLLRIADLIDQAVAEGCTAHEAEV